MTHQADVAAARRRTPVALFCYNRPDHTERVLAALAACNVGVDCEFHFFADGAKSPAHASQVERTREVLREWAPRFGARVVEREHNMGLARSIAGGVGELCAAHGRVVVVEDDLLLAPDFLRYMVAALDRYEDDEQVMQVSGCTLSPPASLSTDAFLLPVTTTWGWGTWARAWKCFAWAPADLESARSDVAWRRRFDLDGTCDFSGMLEDRLAGRNDSWGILWWYAVSRQQGLVVYPAQTLVVNGGFDGSGTHCGDVGLPGLSAGAAVASPTLPVHLTFPPADGYVHAHLAQLEDYFRAASATAADASAARPFGVLRALASRMKKGLRNALRQ